MGVLVGHVLQADVVGVGVGALGGDEHDDDGLVGLRGLGQRKRLSVDPGQLDGRGRGADRRALRQGDAGEGCNEGETHRDAKRFHLGSLLKLPGIPPPAGKFLRSDREPN